MPTRCSSATMPRRSCVKEVFVQGFLGGHLGLQGTFSGWFGRKTTGRIKIFVGSPILSRSHISGLFLCFRQAGFPPRAKGIAVLPETKRKDKFRISIYPPPKKKKRRAPPPPPNSPPPKLGLGFNKTRPAPPPPALVPPKATRKHDPRRKPKTAKPKNRKKKEEKKPKNRENRENR